MDNQRLLTWGLFIMMAWFTYQTWVMDYRTPQPVAEPTDAPLTIDNADGTTAVDLPEVGDQASVPAALPQTDAAPADAEAATVTVTTDVMRVTISTRGATITEAVMLRYPVDKDDPDSLITMLSPTSANYGAFKIGLRGGGIADHTTLLTTTRDSWDIGSDEELRVPFSWTNDAGLSLSRTLVFRRGSYQVDVEQTVTNNGTDAWRGDQYIQLVRRSFEMERSMFDPDTFSFDGPIIYDGESSDKIDRDDLIKKGPQQQTTTNGWVASIQHHFLNAIVPDRDAQHVYQVSVANNRMQASVVGAKQTVEPGTSHTFTSTLFTGPKLQDQLEQIDPRLKLTVDYGILTMLSQPMFWLLSFAHDYVANWGAAIIVVTILIKLVFYKLTESSGRSMAKMRNLQPRMKALQDRYKDDRQALSQAMMDLYRKEQVNPAAGCLPILVQMPFFLAFYWVLVESVEMRQAPFALWLTDLSSRDPYFILPLIMGAAMLIQQKLNPAPADPVQARVMQIMPIMFTFFFAFFPAGLVLYWATNTILSIAQQWKINRVVEREAKEVKDRRAAGKKAKQADDPES